MKNVIELISPELLEQYQARTDGTVVFVPGATNNPACWLFVKSDCPVYRNIAGAAGTAGDICRTISIHEELDDGEKIFCVRSSLWPGDDFAACDSQSQAEEYVAGLAARILRNICYTPERASETDGSLLDWGGDTDGYWCELARHFGQREGFGPDTSGDLADVVYH